MVLQNNNSNNNRSESDLHRYEATKAVAKKAHNKF